jgi:hypothetical protein
MLLHIADTIMDAGPVWVYWVFVMERLCGQLQRSVTSRRQPYSSMNMWAIEWEQLKIIRNQFGLSDVLRSGPSRAKDLALHEDCKYISLLYTSPLMNYRPTCGITQTLEIAYSRHGSAPASCSCYWDKIR